MVCQFIGPPCIANLREARKLRGDLCFARLYLENGKSYESSIRYEGTRLAFRQAYKMQCSDLLQTAESRGPEVTRMKGSQILISKFFLNVCQCYKSRSRSSEVTVGATPLWHLYQTAKYEVYVTSRRCSDNRNVATRQDSELMGDFAPYISKAVSHRKKVKRKLTRVRCTHRWPFGYKMQIAMLRFAVCTNSPKGQGCSAHAVYAKNIIMRSLQG